MASKGEAQPPSALKTPINVSVISLRRNSFWTMFLSSFRSSVTFFSCRGLLVLNNHALVQHFREFIQFDPRQTYGNHKEFPRVCCSHAVNQGHSFAVSITKESWVRKRSNNQSGKRCKQVLVYCCPSTHCVHPASGTSRGRRQNRIGSLHNWSTLPYFVLAADFSGVEHLRVESWRARQAGLLRVLRTIDRVYPALRRAGCTVWLRFLWTDLKRT